MRVRVDHRTTYRYATPAHGIVQLLRLRPAAMDCQHIVDWRIDVDVDATLHPWTDSFGNPVATLYAAGPLDAVTVHVAGEVDVTDNAGIVRAPEPLPPPVFLRSTPLTAAGEGIAAFAERFVKRPPLDALHALSGALYAEMRFEIGQTTPTTTAEAALAAGHGVCQDFAHIFAGAARRLGLPARYVSGHLAREGRQQAAHAWAEALVPDLGWVAFDPANGVSADDRYLRVAVGLDYLDAAPIRGSRRGGEGERLDVSVLTSEARVGQQ